MLRLFILVYGQPFLNLFEQACCRSLLQPRNRAALQGAVVSLYSDAASMAQATLIASELGHVEPHVIDLSGDDAQIQQRCVLDEIRCCIDAKATMLMVCPDLFWGDGTVPNLLAIAGEAEDICVAVPHPRVDHRDAPHIRANRNVTAIWRAS